MHILRIDNFTRKQIHPRQMSEDENLRTIVIKSHSNISKIVTKCLVILTPKSPNSSTRLILIIKADAKVAGKAITITEIVKRRLKEHGQTITQTTRIQDKPAEDELPVANKQKKHLQGEGYVKGKKKVDAQIVMQLERTGDGSV